MFIPDPAVYAALPILASGVTWAAKAFIDSRARRRISPGTNHVELTLGDFQQIADLLKRELNGRYMFANEARQKFDELANKMDEKVAELKDCIQSLSRNPSARTRCTD